MKKLTVGIAIIASLVCVGNANPDFNYNQVKHGKEFYMTLNEYNLMFPEKASTNKYRLNQSYDIKTDTYIMSFLLDFREEEKVSSSIIEKWNEEDYNNNKRFLCGKYDPETFSDKAKFKYMAILKNEKPIMFEHTINLKKDCYTDYIMRRALK